MKKIAFLAVLLMATPAYADNGIIAGIHGGGSFLTKPDFKVNSGDMDADALLSGLGLRNTRGSSDWGWAAGAHAGYRYGIFRGFLDGTWTQHNTSVARDFSITKQRCGECRPYIKNGEAAARMDLRQIRLFIVGTVDVYEQDSPVGKIVPYLGGGGGAVNVRASHVQASASLGRHSGAVGSFKDNDWTWGAKGVAGVRLAVTKEIDVSLEYNYVHVGAPKFNFAGVGVKVGDLKHHEGLLKVTYKF